ncbi:hypothetical protein FACS1894186_6900 [Alphaproteobacteria bacterium]|nr:hypothetical protein FACS1894186_6900 [Alphaproteobacteria bacterium]
MKVRKVAEYWQGKQTVDGAGVRLRRLLGYSTAERADPFLLLDDMTSSDPEDYAQGFPWHAKRGIETITYVLEGSLAHRDSAGVSGAVPTGAAHWIRTGAGIIHEEMPVGAADGRFAGFHLWLNMPRDQKMADPLYRDARPSVIPVVSENGHKIRVLAGAAGGAAGPLRESSRGLEGYDISLAPGKPYVVEIAAEKTIVVQPIAGRVAVGGTEYAAPCALLMGAGGRVEIAASGGRARVIVWAALPVGEPIAWGGSIVMASDDDLEQAFRDLEKGRFTRGKAWADDAPLDAGAGAFFYEDE